MLEIVRLRPAHAYALADFFASIVADDLERFFHPHGFSAPEAERICRYEGKDQYFGVFHNQSIVAYGMLRGWDAGFATPSLGLAVCKAFQGKGIGALLLTFLHACAQASGASRIRLTVVHSNTSAIKLYQRFGYELCLHEGGIYVGHLELSNTS